MRVVGAMKINTYEFIQNKKKGAKCTLHKYNPTMFLAKMYIYCHKYKKCKNIKSVCAKQRDKSKCFSATTRKVIQQPVYLTAECDLQCTVFNV